MASKADLFRLDPLPVYLKNRDQQIRNFVERIESVIELDRLTADILDGAVISPVKLHRQHASLATSKSTEGVEVKVSVPLEGYTRLLQHPPVGWSQPGLHGFLEQGSRASRVSRPWLRLGHCFKEDASPVQIDQWMSEVLDQIQQALDFQTPVIAEYNDRVRHLVKTLVATRRGDIQERQRSAVGAGQHAVAGSDPGSRGHQLGDGRLGEQAYVVVVVVRVAHRGRRPGHLGPHSDDGAAAL